MGMDGQARVSGLLGCSCPDHRIRPGRGLLPSRPELDVVRPRKRSGHLLGGFADVVAENRIGESRSRNSGRLDASIRIVSRLSGNDPRDSATRATHDHLARLNTAMATSLAVRDRRSADYCSAMLRSRRDTNKQLCNRGR
jgi:hypothetical protein